MSRTDAGPAQAFYRALDRHDFEGAAEFLLDEVLLHGMATAEVYRGQAAALGYYRGWGAAFPDLHFKRLSRTDGVQGGVVEYEMVGTHTGPWVSTRGHIPPTGMEVQVQCCDVLAFRGPRIAEIRSYFDSMTLLRQLGLIGGSPLHAPERRAGLELYAQSVDGNAPERHRSVVHRFVQDVYNRQDPSAVADTCGPGFLWHGGPLGEASGLTAYRAVLSAFFIGFPDFQVQELDTIAERDRVVLRFMMSGTHLGEFQGVSPTLKRVHGGGTIIFRMEENRIVEEWWQGDLLALLQQLDAAPATVRLSS